jgi:hypothetical protein
MMVNDITNSCGGNKRGCRVVIVLPYDRRPGSVLAAMHAAGNDLQKVLSLAHPDLDKEPAKKTAVEEMVA